MKWRDRFDDDDKDTVGSDLILNATSAKFTITRNANGKVIVSYSIRGGYRIDDADELNSVLSIVKEFGISKQQKVDEE
jgi:hypothetical protein